MNEELLQALAGSISTAPVRTDLHEAVWLQSVTSSLAGGISPLGAKNAADDILEGFKLRFEPTIGGQH